MADCGKEILSNREGTDQLQRFIEALNPESIHLNNFSLEDWMKFAYQFARHVNYFNTADNETPAGDWRNFFISENELKDFLVSVEKGNEITPHLALFVCFIKLLEFSQKRFNQLTRRHLDFYYRNILQIEKLPASPDKVHLIFELAKNATEESIPQHTQLDGGKDAKGTKRIYKTESELVANKIKVGQLRNLYNDHESKKLKAAPSANSYNGLGEAFPDDNIQWWPFGYYGDNTYPELPDARTGFALSSKILQLKEGSRNILITIVFSEDLPAISESVLKENLEIFCTGEKGWLGPFKAQPVVLDKDNNPVFSSGLDVSTTLKLAFQIPKEEKAVVNYDAQIHGENYATELPVCRFLIQTENEEAFDLYRNLVEKQWTNLTIDVDVRDMKQLSLGNDTGTLNAEKPFLPFGTQPVTRSNFSINCPELFEKDWNEIDVNLQWKNTPEKAEGSSRDAFVDLYFAYRKEHLYQTSPSSFSLGMYVEKDTGEPSIKKTLETGLIKDRIFNLFPWDDSPDNLIVDGNDYFTARVEIRHKEEWLKVHDEITLFNPADEGFKTSFKVENTGYEVDKNGPVRLSLNHPFYHELYPKIYALAFSSEDQDALIPNEPYTPMIEWITLDYTAQASANPDNSKTAWQTGDITLFHEHPFGQTEEHPYLKSQVPFLSDNEKMQNTLVPTYCKGGELYIGLENAQPRQTVSLLVQVLEGSENPQADSFTGKQKIEWSVLCQNEWQKLSSSFMISNQTDNFLQSGIVRFSIPGEANSDNTRLPSGYIWVKAQAHKTYDAVCKIIAIHAQAVTATFSNNNNELTHLKNGLAAETISKMVQRLSSVKGISQPYSSFGGKPAETDAQYYRRVSERLRHKKRALTLWDYEHLVLEKFPEIHKVKCLNHSWSGTEDGNKVTRFLAPGNVLVIVIPDIVNKNVFDVYQPRVSQATLNDISSYINQLNSLHVNAVVSNPEYEEVKVDLKVKFHKGYDESYYQKVLNEDITKILSPWAFEESARIEFGISLHRSTIIQSLEKLKYVDYLEDVTLIKGTETSTKSVAPSSPAAILVSAKQHNISTETTSCTETTETEETCQT